MNYRYTQKDIKIIDVSNQNDWMYNWIREKSGKVKVETNSSGSKDNNPYNTHSKEQEYCNIHNIKKDSDNVCNVCMEKRNV
jgi:hypothetical protein